MRIEDALETLEGVGGAVLVNVEVTLTVELGVGVEVRVPGTPVMVIEGETEGERVGLVVKEALGEVFPVYVALDETDTDTDEDTETESLKLTPLERLGGVDPEKLPDTEKEGDIVPLKLPLPV